MTSSCILIKMSKRFRFRYFKIVRFQNGFNKVVVELLVVQFWFEIILVISNRTRAARSFDFEITHMISDQIALHSVQLPLFTDSETLLSVLCAR